MAIVKETGTGSSTSTSYVSESDLIEYAIERGITISCIPAQLLHKSMDYLEQMTFVGNKYTDAQALQWPRSNVSLDGYSVLTTEIPVLIQQAQMEIALSIDAGNNPLADKTREAKREKVGDIEVEYSDQALSSVYLTGAMNKLSKLIKNTGFGLVADRA